MFSPTGLWKCFHKTSVFVTDDQIPVIHNQTFCLFWLDRNTKQRLFLSVALWVQFGTGGFRYWDHHHRQSQTLLSVSVWFADVADRTAFAVSGLVLLFYYLLRVHLFLLSKKKKKKQKTIAVSCWQLQCQCRCYDKSSQQTKTQYFSVRYGFLRYWTTWYWLLTV